MNSFFSLFVSFVFLFSSTTFALEKKAHPLNASPKNSDSPLLSAKDLEKLSPDEKERYFDALREFFQENQAEPQTFSQYFMDILSGGLVANATEADTESFPTCDNQIFRRGTTSNDMLNPARNKFCFDRFIEKMRAGELGACTSQKAGTRSEVLQISCSGFNNSESRKYEIHDFETSTSDGKNSTVAPVINSAVTDSKKYEDRNNMPNAGERLTKEVRDAADRSSPGANGGSTLKAAQDGAADAKAKGSLARCFYAGFVINKSEKAKSCVAVQDLCASNQRVIPAQSGIQKALGCGTKDKINSSCVSKDDTKGKIAAGKKNDEVVACNPLLFGLSGSADPKSVICVKRSGNASQNCLEKMDENAKKNLDALLKDADGAKAFNDLKGEIEKQCKPYWKFKEGASDPIKDEDARKIPVKAPVPPTRPAAAGAKPATDGAAAPAAAAPADAGEGIDEAVKGRSEKANMDFNRTCKVLLNRVREIKPSAAGGTAAPTTAAPAAGGARPATPGGTAPTRNAK